MNEHLFASLSMSSISNISSDAGGGKIIFRL